MLIAEKMAAIHYMEVPLHKEPGWLWDTIDRRMKLCDKRLRGHVPDYAKLLTNVDLHEEAIWLRRRLEEGRCPMAFCENNMQQNNLLVSQDRNDNCEGQLVLIE